MLTVSQLAKRFKISRTTLLYYERAGLLEPKSRSASGYRLYGGDEIRRLESILSFRASGVPIATIGSLLNRADDTTQEQILREQFYALEREVQKLRQQQEAIVLLLKHPKLLEQTMINKDRWVEIMRAAGLNDTDMHNWHKQFEAMEPQAHQEFLESLSINATEIEKIRKWSKG
ncbi:MerR family transcriptional regulator [Corallincola platygyrae]|uniref:MerR family transcriptional regulator n=1 Tax=Corallincola platygyrae TaxID=1193278 RepID=A0ABW4XIY4_9GAMM